MYKRDIHHKTTIYTNPNQSKVEQHCSASTLTTPFSQITDILSSTPVDEKKNNNNNNNDDDDDDDDNNNNNDDDNNNTCINYLIIILNLHKLSYNSCYRS